MAILKLLSEEVFDFSFETMTSAKVAALKQQMWNEFSEVFKLCTEILQEASKISLVRATLETLFRFLGWIPLGFIFETPIIDLLTNRFLSPPEFRNISLRCLAEIASLPSVGQYGNRLTILYTSVISTITVIVPPSTNFVEAYQNAGDQGEELVLNLALFLTNFFSNHLALIEDAHPDANLLGHAYLVKISAVEEREIFKICVEYWTKLLAALYNEQSIMPISSFGISFGDEVGAAGMGVKMRKDAYAEILSNLRLVVIERMVKPEEVGLSFLLSSSFLTLCKRCSSWKTTRAKLFENTSKKLTLSSCTNPCESFSFTSPISTLLTLKPSLLRNSPSKLMVASGPGQILTRSVGLLARSLEP